MGDQIYSFITQCVLLLWCLAERPVVITADPKPIQVSSDNTLVWGTGLKANIVLPVRYFFIQAVDHSGQNFTKSVGEKAFQVSLSNTDTRNIWYSIDILDRKDGSYIVRYRLHNSYTDIKIHVKHKNQDVAESPFLLQGHVYHERCYCPAFNIDKWLKIMGCPSTYRQIDEDLKLWKIPIDMEKMAPDAVKRFSDQGRHSICHYKIIDNKISRQCYGEHIGFKMFSDAPFLSLARKTILPDMEFFVNLGDWPLEKRKNAHENPFPMFSWCGSHDTRDIVMPTYDITESTLEMMSKVTLDMLSVQSNSVPWFNKTSRAFWRGRDSRQERLDLVVMGRKKPEIINAALTNMFFFPKDEHKYGKLVKPISFFDFFKYKYQLNIDGTVAAYRLPYLLAGLSVVLKQDSEYYEHFYKQLSPFVHYIPFRRDLSNLLDQILWAKEHDHKAKTIAESAQKFVLDNLMPKDIFCYHAVLFRKYSKLLKFPPTYDASFDKVDQPTDQDSLCECHRKKKTKKPHSEF